MRVIDWMVFGLFPLALTLQWVPEQQTPFLPPEGQTLLIIGQDLGAIGGLPDYADGYTDHVGLVPAGLTTYTSITGLNGLESLANWGSGDVNAQLLMEAERYQHTVLAIGLWLGAPNLQTLAKGGYDDNLATLGRWIAAQKRPIFLRIGYEFDGPWNAFDPAEYVLAWRHIVDELRQLQVTNVATVWQAATAANFETYQSHDWLDWYPGDDYVDWFGLSYFTPDTAVLDAFLKLAREHGKPVMIAEATPRGLDLSRNTGSSSWQTWFAPFFDYIHTNADVIRAVAYINVDWDSQAMWSGQGWGDSRVQSNAELMDAWRAEIESDFWLQAAPDLFSRLNDPA
jgi:hypothetical protein